MRVRGIVCAVGVLVCAAGLACGSGGGGGGSGGNGSGGASCGAFMQGFLPVRLPGAGRGDVAFRTGGDLYAVDGSSDVTAIACSNGAVSLFAQVDNGNAVLRSITVGPDGRVYAGDGSGRVWATDADKSQFSLLIDTGSSPLTGLAVAPEGFGSFGGQLIAAAGSAGILRITTSSDLAAVATLVDPSEVYVDVAFSGTTLFALDATNDEIDTVAAAGTRATLAGTAGTLGNPVGMAVDDGRAEIWVADAGVDALRALPVTGGAPSDRAPYDFDASAPSGLAYDGSGTLAWITRGSVVVRGAAVPRVDASFTAALSGPTVGYGDLELDRDGSFVLVANDVSPPTNNYLFRVTRAGVISTLSSAIGNPGEELVSLAIDPATQTLYIGSDGGNIYRRSENGTVSLLVSASADPVLGLELAPATFGSFGGRLIATTEAGAILVIDPQSPTPVGSITPSETLTTLNDLVFASDGTLYAVENDGSSTPHVLTIAANGTVTEISTSPGQLGRPDGIEIDEGAGRLLVTSAFSTNNRLLEIEPGTGQVTQLALIDIDEGFFPSGIVYDRLGTVVYREGDTSTSLDAVPIFP